MKETGKEFNVPLNKFNQHKGFIPDQLMMLPTIIKEVKLCRYVIQSLTGGKKLFNRPRVERKSKQKL